MNQPRAFLGQVPLVLGPSSWRGPGGFPIGALPYGRPIGRTGEIISQQGWVTNHHCYECSDGEIRDLTLPEADDLRAQGIDCQFIGNQYCPGLKAAPPAQSVSPVMAAAARRPSTPATTRAMQGIRLVPGLGTRVLGF